MYIDPEKAHREKLLIKEISRLEALIYDDNQEEKRDLEFVGKVMDSLESHKTDLNKLWSQIRKEHAVEIQRNQKLLQGIFIALVCIIA